MAAVAPLGRDELLQRLRERGIAAKGGIMTAHREPAYRQRCEGLRLPISEKLSDRSVLLPLYPDLTEAEQDTVIDALREEMRP